MSRKTLENKVFINVGILVNNGYTLICHKLFHELFSVVLFFERKQIQNYNHAFTFFLYCVSFILYLQENFILGPGRPQPGTKVSKFFFLTGDSKS